MPPQCILLAEQPTQAERRDGEVPVSQLHPPNERAGRVREAEHAERNAAQWQNAMSPFDSESPPSNARELLGVRRRLALAFPIRGGYDTRRANEGVAYREGRLSRSVCAAWPPLPLSAWAGVTPAEAADGDADENHFWGSAAARWPRLDVCEMAVELGAFLGLQGPARRPELWSMWYCLGGHPEWPEQGQAEAEGAEGGGEELEAAAAALCKDAHSG
jgi:hypothetical protein